MRNPLFLPVSAVNCRLGAYICDYDKLRKAEVGTFAAASLYTRAKDKSVVHAVLKEVQQ